MGSIKEQKIFGFVQIKLGIFMISSHLVRQAFISMFFIAFFYSKYGFIFLKKSENIAVQKNVTDL